MALILSVEETTLGIPAPQAYAVLRDIATINKTEVRVMFGIYFSQAQRDSGGLPIDYQQCIIPQAVFEAEGGLYSIAYQWAKANMPYFANAVDA